MNIQSGNPSIVTPATVNPRPRVLHLLKWLPRGGIETWLTHVWAHGRDGPVRHEVLLMQDEIGPYEQKVRDAGVVIHILPMRSKAGWFLSLHRFLKREGPFSGFHVHVDSIISGPALAVAASAGVPVRIVHNHAARSMGADYQKLRFKLREGLGNAIAACASTRQVAISDMAMQHLAGPNWRSRNNCTILLYGFDYSGNIGAAKRAAELRRSLEIADGATVIGHVGRFDPVKNHAFLLDSFAAYLKRDSNAVLVMIGRGPLQPDYEEQADRLGISGQLRFAGGTDDIPAFMALFDIFVFPSFSEGLGIVVLEAQAAGTPVLMPENMPAEVIVIKEGVTLLPLSAGEDAWADAIETILAKPSPERSQWLARVESSAFGMQRCIQDLNTIYQEELAANA